MVTKVKAKKPVKKTVKPAKKTAAKKLTLVKCKTAKPKTKAAKTACADHTQMVKSIVEQKYPLEGVTVGKIKRTGLYTYEAVLIEQATQCSPATTHLLTFKYDTKTDKLTQTSPAPKWTQPHGADYEKLVTCPCRFNKSL